jgi:hypothetical protein
MNRQFKTNLSEKLGVSFSVVSHPGRNNQNKKLIIYLKFLVNLEIILIFNKKREF